MLRNFYTWLDRFALRLETWAIDHARVVLALGLLFALVAGLGLLRISFANDYRIFFESDDPQRAAHERSEARFTGSDTVNIVIHAPKGDLFVPRRIQAVAEATEAAWSIPYATRVDSLTNHQHSYGENDDLIVEPLVEDAAALEPADIARIKRIALTEPAIQGRLLSKDGRTAQIVITLPLPSNDAAAMTRVSKRVEQLKQRLSFAYPDLRIATSGVVLLSHSFYSVAQSDMAKLVPVMTLLLFIAISLFFRSIKPAVAALSVLGLAIFIVVGVAGWLGIALSPASAEAPVIVLTIATAEAIHIIGGMYALQRQGKPRAGAIRGSVRVNHAAFALTTLTDVLGFLCFNFSDTPPFRDLGNLCAFGAIVAYLYSIFFLPALLKVWRFESDSDFLEREHNVEKIADWAVANRKLVLIGFALLTIGLGALAPTLETRDNFIEWLSEGQAFRKDAEFINARLPGIYTMTYALEAGEEGGVSEPRYLQTVERFQRWLEKQPEVADVGSIVDVMRRLNRNMHGDDPAYERLPESRDLAAQYLLLYEMSLPQGKDLADQLTPDKSASRLVIAINDVSSEQMVALKERADVWLRANAPPAMHAPGTGTSLMFAYLTEENTHSMISGTVASFLFIALVTGLALLSWRLGMLSLAPAVAPVIMAFGAWKLIEGSQGLYAAFVASCALGIVVDAVTHFVMKFGKAYKERGYPLEAAIAYAYRTVGVELWIASATLIVGFTVLTFSEFAVIAKLGQMVTLIFVFGLATTFVMLPALLKSALPEQASGLPEVGPEREIGVRQRMIIQEAADLVDEQAPAPVELDSVYDASRPPDVRPYQNPRQPRQFGRRGAPVR